MAPTIRGTYLTVRVEELSPNPRNPNRQSKAVKAALKESIRQDGFTEPIVARRVKGKLEIIGGEHRWRVAQELGMEKVPVIDLGPMPDYLANRHMVVLNELKGKHDEDALAAILQDVKAEGGEAALVVIPFTDAQWADLLDDDAEVPLDEDDVPPPPTKVKLKGNDILAALEVSTSDQAAIAQLVEGLRAWARTRAPDAPPAWQGLLAVLEG